VKANLLIIFVLLLSSSTVAQQKKSVDSLSRKQLIIKDPLTPSRAAFYSAIIPGLGQIHTRRYWTLPFIYGGLGISAYYFNYQTREMNKYRTAYKQRIRGDYSDEFTRKIALNSQLLQGMEYHREYRNLSVLWLVGIYLLNILDANVGAHLLQFNVDDSLSFKPYFNQDNLIADPAVGLALKLQF
jgi:hypothetical protein